MRGRDPAASPRRDPAGFLRRARRWQSPRPSRSFTFPKASGRKISLKAGSANPAGVTRAGAVLAEQLLQVCVSASHLIPLTHLCKRLTACKNPQISSEGGAGERGSGTGAVRSAGSSLARCRGSSAGSGSPPLPDPSCGVGDG